MSFLNTIKKHEVVAQLEGYFITFLGKSKYGKTTFVYDLVKEYYMGDMSKALLLAPEIGYKALDGIYALPITDFAKTSDEQKEDFGNFGFIETVNELIENKKDVPYRMIIIDTLTALEELAVKYVLRTESRKRGKRLESISDIPYGGGYNLVADAIYSQIKRLKQSGFAVICIAHEKIKQVENRDGSTYNLITLNCLGKTVDIIEREADIIMYGDLVTEVTANGVQQERRLRFRSDGNIICGSRFRTMPDYIEHDVTLFLETFKEAVKKSFNDKKISVEEVAERQEKEREERATVYIEKEEEAEDIDYVQAIADLISGMDKETSDKLKVEFKSKFKVINYKTYDEKQLVEAYEIAKGLTN